MWCVVYWIIASSGLHSQLGSEADASALFQETSPATAAQGRSILPLINNVSGKQQYCLPAQASTPGPGKVAGKVAPEQGLCFSHWQACHLLTNCAISPSVMMTLACLQVWGVGGKFGTSAAVGVVLPPAPQMVEKQGWTYVSRPNQVLRGAHETQSDITSIAFSKVSMAELWAGVDGALSLQWHGVVVLANDSRRLQQHRLCVWLSSRQL